MADSPILPGSHRWKLVPSPRGGTPDLPPEFFKFFRDLVTYVAQTQGNTASLADILARLDALEAASTNAVTGQYSVQTFQQDAATIIRLLGDIPAPAVQSYYGTDENGERGWLVPQPGWAPNPYADYLVDENGNYLTDESGNFLTAGDPNPKFDEEGSAAAALTAANTYTDDSIAAIPISSGTWIPTLTNTTNLTGSTVGVGQWIRYGDVVNFSIRVAAQATSGSAGAPVATALGMSMPIAADLTAANQVAGNATIGEAPYVTGQVVADTVNDRFTINWFATSTNNRAVTVTGTYRLV